MIKFILSPYIRIECIWVVNALQQGGKREGGGGEGTVYAHAFGKRKYICRGFFSKFGFFSKYALKTIDFIKKMPNPFR